MVSEDNPPTPPFFFLFLSSWLEPPPELSKLVVKHMHVYGSGGGQTMRAAFSVDEQHERAS